MNPKPSKATKCIHIHQEVYLHYFRINLPILFCVCEISIHCFIIELQYNHVLNYTLYYIESHCILILRSS